MTTRMEIQPTGDRDFHAVMLCYEGDYGFSVKVALFQGVLSMCKDFADDFGDLQQTYVDRIVADLKEKKYKQGEV